MNCEKKYLSFTKKLAYGTGDFASNFFYMMVSSFTMIYLSDTIGMNVGIVGTLIMVSKVLDGITDVFFGRMIDKTHTKMGKARPWMFYSAFPLALCLILMFAIPQSMSRTLQYAYFFVIYTAANALFYTANNISFATLSALITRNESERVSLGSFRYIFAVASSILVMSLTMKGVAAMGGGTVGWRNVALLYAVILVAFNSLASLSVKELPSEEEPVSQGESEAKDESFFHALGTILSKQILSASSGHLPSVLYQQQPGHQHQRLLLPVCHRQHGDHGCSFDGRPWS
jgi:GPH family glycoside/pentoside/hexuronide:cation symporter